MHTRSASPVSKAGLALAPCRRRRHTARLIVVRWLTVPLMIVSPARSAPPTTCLLGLLPLSLAAPTSNVSVGAVGRWRAPGAANGTVGARVCRATLAVAVTINAPHQDGPILGAAVLIAPLAPRAQARGNPDIHSCKNSNGEDGNGAVGRGQLLVALEDTMLIAVAIAQRGRRAYLKSKRDDDAKQRTAPVCPTMPRARGDKGLGAASAVPASAY